MSWRLARSLDQLRTEVRQRWPGTVVWTIGDAAHRNRASDHNPNGAGVVCAIDVVGRTQAAAVTDRLVTTRDPRVAYIIWDGRIISSTTSPWTWRNYTGSNQHTTHCHVSVGRGPDGAKGRPDLYDNRAPWGVTAGEQMLQRGDRGHGVTLMQRALLEWSPDLGPSSWADGIYGPATEAAVNSYQGAAGLERTGNIDGVTAAFLSTYINRFGVGQPGPRGPAGPKGDPGPAGMSQADADGRYARRSHSHSATVELS